MTTPSAAAGLTPMMQRYLEVKQETPGAILLFRMGDFYELFHDDAETAARVLGLTLTSRDKGSANPVPMAGFPYHALDGYLQKLIAAGYRAAICDQVEDPKTAKGMVRREVTRIVTPGTLTEESLLDPRQSNFVAAVVPSKSSVGLAWLELSTGRFQCAEIPLRSARGSSGMGPAAPGTSPGYEPVLDELARLRPAEVLISEAWRQDPLVIALGASTAGTGPAGLHPLGFPLVLTTRPAWCFVPAYCRDQLLAHFQCATLEGFGLDAESPSVTAAGALLEYAREMQRTGVDHIIRIELDRRGSNLLIDDATRRSLELTRTLRDDRRDGSLLSVIDETVTPMGARLLAEWLSNPLVDRQAIVVRQDAIEELQSDRTLGSELRSQLQEAYDLQRLTARTATLRATPRDLVSLARTLALLPKIKALLAGRRSAKLQALEANLDLLAEVRGEIEAALVDDPPLTLTDGGVIRPGFQAALDELRELSRGGKQWIADYQRREIERTGISSLKVGFNKVFGYYLEVTAANFDKVPSDYIRKQTLKNQERYITPELKEYEDKVLRADERARALEQDLFGRLRDRVSRECRRLQQSAEALAQIDVLAGLAHLATQRSYCRPVVVDEPVLDIRDGRHPVLDRVRPSGEFVPNDSRLGDPASLATALGAAGGDETEPCPRILLITGPNMAGKSTYIRQTALLTVMAQIGSFVPARSAVIGIADRIFARVGASDELSRGQSTFMVEMTETARILNTATDRSLVILDEIGRGTSTYDGISLAWAITEFLHDEVRCRTLFATHYHELTELTATLPGLANANVAVREQQGDLVFLHRIMPGAADRSYGIHVARLAGVPREVIARADVILQTLEADHHKDSGELTIPARKPRRKIHARQLGLFEERPEALVDELKRLDPEALSPAEAKQELQRLRGQASS
ncbi:MAG: DNA mismatch repair protein MutS [Planctomyces sp.]|nr:DNA mismatch repair protein MutS [Planctomyces sp.]